MTINQIPIVAPPEEDEYIYSYICRIASLNGFKDASGFVFPYIADEYYKNERQVNHILRSYYGNIYFMRFYESLGIDIDPIKLYLSLSVYPCLSITMLPYRQASFINSIFRSRLQFADFNNDVKGVDNRLLYCPECMEQQIQNKGYYWFKRAHQLPGVEMCHIHHRPLNIYTGQPKQCFSDSVIPGISFADEYNNTNEEYSLFVDQINKACLTLNYNDLRTIIYAYFSDNNLTGVMKDNDLQNLIKSFKHGSFNNRALLKNLQSGRLSLVSHSDILLILFAVFRTYDNFAKYAITYNYTKEDIKDYEYYGDYAPNIAYMRHNCGCVFIGTPYGVQAGWGCPDCLSKYSDEQFANILFKNAYDSHYKMVPKYHSGDKKIFIKHDLCGNTKKVTLSELIAKRDCVCLLHNNAALVKEGEVELNNAFRDSEIKRQEINRQFTNQGYPFELLSYTKIRKPVRVRHLSCRREFEVCYSESFAKRPVCPYCEKLQLKSHRSRKKLTTEADFISEMKRLVGDEYELISPYKNSYTPVALLHKKCGNSLYMTGSKFCQGQRCKCETVTLSRDVLNKIVENCTDGCLSVVAKVASSIKYQIVNNRTGEIYYLSKDEILQELNRVTPSDIIDNEHRHPVNYKDYGIIMRPLYFVIYNDLLKIYSVGDIVNIKDIYKITTLSKNQVINAIPTLLFHGLLSKSGHDYKIS